ncbi:MULTISPECIES: Gfo/Idh/MocA family protein [Salinibaculum]|uniref:Gfo/Idh/MocA family protein n=1 Tax=Salinibaculum TaxID=2732368 RepID=UPI0030CA9BC1
MNVGVVGLGYWGSKVIDEYATLRDRDDIDQVIAIDTDPDALASVSCADAAHESVEAALSEVDALHVATSNATHFSIAETALNADVDVLVEKPLTTDSRTAYDLVELASERGRILQTGHIFRFANVVRRVKQEYEEGQFGELNHLSLRWTHELDTYREADVLWDLLPHPLDILNFVTGEWPRDVTGVSTVDADGTRTAAQVGLDYGDFAATVEVSWVDKTRRRTLEIAGSRRSSVIECVEQSITHRDSNGESAVDVTANNTILAEVENFIRAIETGENTFNSAIVGARTVDAIQSVVEELDE